MSTALTIRIEPTQRTDLLCIHCNMFRTENRIVGQEGDDWFGVHTACIDKIQFHSTGGRHEEADE